MTDITDIIMLAYNFAKTTTWTFYLFGQQWQLTFLQIWLLPVVAGLTISIVKHIIEIVNM